MATTVMPRPSGQSRLGQPACSAVLERSECARPPNRKRTKQQSGSVPPTTPSSCRSAKRRNTDGTVLYREGMGHGWDTMGGGERKRVHQRSLYREGVSESGLGALPDVAVSTIASFLSEQDMWRVNQAFRFRCKTWRDATTKVSLSIQGPSICGCITTRVRNIREWFRFAKFAISVKDCTESSVDIFRTMAIYLGKKLDRLDIYKFQGRTLSLPLNPSLSRSTSIRIMSSKRLKSVNGYQWPRSVSVVNCPELRSVTMADTDDEAVPDAVEIIHSPYTDAAILERTQSILLENSSALTSDISLDHATTVDIAIPTRELPDRHVVAPTATHLTLRLPNGMSHATGIRSSAIAPAATSIKVVNGVCVVGETVTDVDLWFIEDAQFVAPENVESLRVHWPDSRTIGMNCNLPLRFTHCKHYEMTQACCTNPRLVVAKALRHLMAIEDPEKRWPSLESALLYITMTSADPEGRFPVTPIEVLLRVQWAKKTGYSAVVRVTYNHTKKELLNVNRIFGGRDLQELVRSALLPVAWGRIQQRLS